MTSTNDHARTAINARLGRAVSATETPESMGRALYRWILTEGASKGELSEDGKKITIPLTISLQVPAANERKSTFGYCITSFGYDVFCIKVVQEDTPQ